MQIKATYSDCIFAVFISSKMAPPCTIEPTLEQSRERKNSGSGINIYSWDEVMGHDKRDDCWLVIEGEVYNITTWSKRHPGGSKIIGHYAGQDATDAFYAFHADMKSVKKYLKPLHIGSVEDTKVKAIDEDFRKLRIAAEEMGLFKPSYFFYSAYLLHILVFVALAYLTLVFFGTGWIPFITSILLFGTGQMQAGYLQHDFGHTSVFHNRKLDSSFQYFTFGFLKGVSPKFWNYLHNQHHSKTNVMEKDPDVGTIDTIFVAGQVMPVEVAKKKKKSLPFNHQHNYFYLIPPLFTTILFQTMPIQFVYKRRLWLDGVVMVLSVLTFFYTFVPILGWAWAFFYFEAYKVMESTWFAWVALSSHIPMNIGHDDKKPWLRLHLSTTSNVEKSFFNDWFTGHLNFQIEHHLFPTMPRHNLYKIQPLVKSLCKKHGIPFQVKSLYNAFADIIRSLKHSGELWSVAYNDHHVLH